MNTVKKVLFVIWFVLLFVITFKIMIWILIGVLLLYALYLGVKIIKLLK